MVEASEKSWEPYVLPLAVVFFHLACLDRYGFFRDELYFVACGQHLAWGYVDQPPLIALIARLAWWLCGHGGSILLFRLPAALSHAATAWVAWRLAASWEGGRTARWLAATAVAVAPVHLAHGHLLTMNSFELLLWASAALVAVVAMSAPRAWLGVGALLGLAILDKYSAALFAVCIVFGLLATPARQHLRTRWFWGGVAVALLLAMPTVLWQFAHGLPFLELLENGRRGKNAILPLATLVRSIFWEQGYGGAALALAGLAWLLTDARAAGSRFLGVAILAFVLVTLQMHPKPYYLAPGITPLFAAGAVALERATRKAWARRGALALVAASALPMAPLALPLLPIQSMLQWQARLGVVPQHLERKLYSDVPQHYADQFGWPERVAAVVEVVRRLTPEERAQAVVYTDNYGRAAALQLLGAGLDLPVVCGHNQYYLWGVPGQPVVVVALGGDITAYGSDFEQVSEVGRTPTLPEGMPFESDIPIFVLRRPRAPFTDLFSKCRHFE